MVKKRYITLLEIMIVILLIGIITSVVGYNVKGSLEKGKVFKTQQAQTQIRELLLLEVARGTNIEDVVKDPKKYLKESGLVRDIASLLKDGWNEPFEIKTNVHKTDIIVISPHLQNKKSSTKNKNENKSDQASDEEEDDQY